MKYSLQLQLSSILQAIVMCKNNQIMTSLCACYESEHLFSRIENLH
jgi:hypothetical protein